MKKKTKTESKTNEQTNLVQTATNPEWVDKGLAGVGQQIGDLSNADPHSFVAGPDALQTQAAQGASGLGQFGKTGVAGTSPLDPYANAMGTFDDMRSAGANTYNPTTGRASSLLDNLGSYMSPYTNDVVNTSLADFDFGAGQTRAQQKLDMAGAGAFGGSGSAITQSLTEDALNRGRGSLSANLRDQAFNTGASLSGQDADRRQGMTLANMGAMNSAGQFNAGQQDQALQSRMAGASGLLNTAGAQQGEQRANIGAQGSIGAMMQQLAQAQAAAPLGLLGTQAGLYGSLPLGLLHGQTTNGTSSGTSSSTQTVSDPMGSIANLMQGGGNLAAGLAMFSDERLKRDVVKVGDRPDGLGVYLFRYLWSPIQYLGVMAQEVLKLKPEAVQTHASGFLMVDYGRL